MNRLFWLLGAGKTSHFWVGSTSKGPNQGFLPKTLSVWVKSCGAPSRIVLINHRQQSTISGCYKLYPMVGYSCTTLSLEGRAKSLCTPFGCHFTSRNHEHSLGWMGLNFRPMLIHSQTNVPADLPRMTHHN